MIVQSQYWEELDRYGVIYRYDHSWQGIIDYIKDNIEDKKQAKLAVERVIAA